jgi:peptidoglycan/LPS O-acetylase OafA/YrhL
LLPSSTTNPGYISTKNPRSAGIDFLRGLAILAVVALHLRIHIPTKSHFIERWPEHLRLIVFGSGYYGVMVFLVISGYLITSISLRRWGSLQSVRPVAFYQLRFARIAPPLLLLIAILIPPHLRMSGSHHWLTLEAVEANWMADLRRWHSRCFVY